MKVLGGGLNFLFQMSPSLVDWNHENHRVGFLFKTYLCGCVIWAWVLSLIWLITLKPLVLAWCNFLLRATNTKINILTVFVMFVVLLSAHQLKNKICLKLSPAAAVSHKKHVACKKESTFIVCCCMFAVKFDIDHLGGGCPKNNLTFLQHFLTSDQFDIEATWTGRATISCRSRPKASSLTFTADTILWLTWHPVDHCL